MLFRSELTPKKDVLFIIGDWNAKVGSQEIAGVTGKFGLGLENEAGQKLIALNSHASQVMLKILQAKLQQCVNQELPDVQAVFTKGRGTREQIVNIHWIIEIAREFQKNIYFCFIDCAKAFDCVDHSKL